MKGEARTLIRSLMWKTWRECGYSSRYHFGNLSHAKNRFAREVRGKPFLIENHNRNFEVIAPLKKGGIGHCLGNGRHHKMRWHGPAVFGRGKADIVSLINTHDRKLVAVLEKKGRLISYIRARNGRWKLSQSHEEG